MTDDLRALALDPEACIKGTPMIPLHRDTLLRIADVIDAAERGWCDCPLRARHTGHRPECWMPAFIASLAALKPVAG